MTEIVIHAHALNHNIHVGMEIQDSFTAMYYQIEKSASIRYFDT